MTRIFSRPGIRRLLPALFLFATLSACHAEPAQPETIRGEHMLWKITGERNTIWLFGSVHMLREQDYPLAPAILAAYDDADALVMELDFDDLDPLDMQRRLLDQSRMEEGTTLSGYLGEESYERAREMSAGLNINIDMFSYFEPWFAALTITTLELAKRGFVPEHGIEPYFSKLAERDGKSVIGLETLEYQLGIFDNMSRNMQRDLLIQTLQDVTVLDEEFGQILQAWRTGDVDRLGELLLDGFADFPQLYEALIVTRNKTWAKEIAGRVDDGTDYLVIVGALHLAGKDSLLRMLERHGIRARQL